MEQHIEQIGILLLVAALVAILARRFHIPYSVGLVLTGAALVSVPGAPHISLTRDIIFTALLPPLIFEAALALRWADLRRQLPVVLVMATLGLVLAALVTAVGMVWLGHWPWMSAAVFGVLVAATDPVAVIATFKEAGVTGRLRLLVEAESLFNDGTAAVMFSIVIAIAAGQAVSPAGVLGNLALTVGGGIGCGVMVAFAMLYLAGQSDDHLVEITLTTITAYGSFLLAEHYHLSGVLATLTAGLILGNVTVPFGISHKGREAVEAFWEYIGFAANSLIFLLIGMHGVQQDLGSLWPLALLAIVLVTLGRVAAVYPVSLMFARSSLRVSMAHQHILFWGGLRGALALALALGLPEDIPARDAVVSTTFAVVAFSLLVQGLTMKPLLRKLGELPAQP